MIALLMAADSRILAARLLYQQALELEGEDRERFLDRECAGDERLRATVTDLLSKDASTDRQDAPGKDELPGPVPAQKLQNRYRLEGMIGRGGMGVVYAAHDELLDRPVAVKMLLRGDLGETSRQRFLREARAAAALNHANVVAVYDAGEVDGRPYLVMEKVEGVSLERSPPSDLDEILAIGAGICAALEHAHERGLVHRDLKPANVLVVADSRPPEVKLTDMGIALARGGPRVTRTGAIAGTPTYMAPEQCLGHKLDGRADLYAFGVLLYEWATGRPPFEGDDALAVVSQHINAPVVPPRNLRPELPASFERLVMRLLAKEPSQRFASAAEARAALADVRRETGEETFASALSISGLTRGRIVGRQAELERLQAAWRGVREAGGHLVLLSGEPGVGKTRLARELVASVGLEGGKILAGGCYEHEAMTPYMPFVEALRQFVREAEDGPLGALLGDSAAEIARLAPEIESRLGPFQRESSLLPQEQRLRLFDHVARFFARLAQPHGLLVFLDDLHWADPGSFELLHDLLRNLRTAPVLVLGVYRDTDIGPSHPLARALVDWERERVASRMPIERLDHEGTRSMLATLLDQPEIPEELVIDLHRETEGNPFFVEEIVKALVAGGGLVRRRSGWTRAPTEEVMLPQSLKSAIGSRLEKIGEACLGVLRTAAVLGKDFEFTRLAAIVDLAEDPLLDLLDEAVAAQIIMPGRGETFAFTHDKIREVLYDEVNPIRRRRVHRRIAERLLDLQAAGVEVAVENLAYHFIAAGDNARGLQFAREAAAAARRVFAFDTAIDLLGQALGCARSLGDIDEVVDVQETLGAVAVDSGDFARAAEALEAALEVAEREPVRSRLHVKAADTYLVNGDRRGRDHVQAALDTLDPARQPQLVAEAEMIRGRFEHLEGNLRRAAELYQRALELARTGAPDHDLLIALYANLSGTHQHLAEFSVSNEYAHLCIELGERHDLPQGRMMGHEFLAENNYYLGRWVASVDHGEIEEREALAFQAGNRLLWSKFRGFSLHQLGRLREAERLVSEALGSAQETGERRIELFFRLILGEVALDGGRVEEALETARGVVDSADSAGLLNHRITGRAGLCRALVRSGATGAAAAEARIAVDLLMSSDSTGLLLIHGATLAEALFTAEHNEEATDVLARHEAIARETGAAARLAQNQRVRGLVAARAGERDGALHLFDQAISGFTATDSRTALAIAFLDRAALAETPQAAAADRQRSQELQRELGLDVVGLLA